MRIIYPVVLITILTTISASPLPAAESKVTAPAQLATGYEAAFKQMRKISISILYTNADTVETTPNVKKIKAYGGTLLVTTSRGKQQVLNAAKVVKIIENWLRQLWDKHPRKEHLEPI